jgi:hypothetical protein
MKQNRKIFITSFLLLAGLIFGCSKMNSTYIDFVKDGPISYTAKPDSLKMHPGRYRLTLSWLIIADPKVTKAIVYWNNRKDSVNVTIDKSGKVNVVLEQLAEGTYVFEIFTFDDAGHTSVKTEAIANVYGDNYLKTLLIRPVNVASIIGHDTARIDWGSASYKEAVASELSYTDLSGVTHNLLISSDSLSTILTKVNAGTLFTYRTKYLPSPIALDSFYTEYKTQRIKGPPIETSKAGWTITASSEDVAGKRTAVNLIDGNLTNLYVNQIASGITYPHWTMVDMKKVTNEIEGFYFYQRSTNPLKTLDIFISTDGVVWESLGEFVLENTPTVNTASPQTARPVYVNLSVPRSFRYFKQVYKNDYGNSVNVNIHETGVFTR